MRSIDDNATMPDKEALSNGPRGQISILVHRFVHPPLSLLYRHLSDATISSHLLLTHRSLSSRFVRVHRPRTTSSRKIRSSLHSSASYKHNTSLPQVKKYIIKTTYTHFEQQVQNHCYDALLHHNHPCRFRRAGRTND